MAAELTNYTRIKNDVLSLIASGVLSKREMQVVLVVIRESWGWRGGRSNWTEKPFTPSTFTQQIGLDRSNAQKTVLSLLRRNILLQREEADGFHLAFNEHPETWLKQPQGEFGGQNNHDPWSKQPRPVVKTTTDIPFNPKCDADLPDPKETLKETLKKDTSGGGENVTKRGAYKFTETDMKLAQRLAFRIRQNKPDVRLPENLEQWANTMRLMREQDKREPLRIAQVVDWCQKDPFWCANILSADKLRIQFDRLELTMNRQQRLAERQPETSNTLARLRAQTAQKLAELGGDAP